MLKKVINVGGKEVAFRSSATVPRLYRAKFKRDIFKDLAKLESSYKGSKEEGEEFAIDDLEIFENVAYIMAYHADNTQKSHQNTDFVNDAVIVRSHQTVSSFGWGGSVEPPTPLIC